MNEKDLLKLKERIDSAKSRVSELNGKKSYLLQELKRTWECSSVAEAEKLLARMTSEVEQLNKQIADSTRELERKMTDGRSR